MPLLACRGISPPPLLVQPLNLPLPPSLPFLDSLRLQFLLPPLLSLSPSLVWYVRMTERGEEEGVKVPMAAAGGANGRGGEGRGDCKG